MMYGRKGHFEFSEAALKKVLCDVLSRPENADVRAKIEHSPFGFSKSLYIRFSIGDITTSLRVSDHKCKRQRQFIVQDSTGVEQVYNVIERTIIDLKYKRLQLMLNGGLNGYKTN